MSAEVNMPKVQKTRPFWLQLLIILGVDSLLVLLLAWLLGDWEQISNFYFLSSLVLLGIAVVPVFGEWGGNVRLVSKALSRRQKLAPMIKAVEPRYQRGARTTYLYGTAAVTVFFLSLISLNI